MHPLPTTRLFALDWMRGAVMVLMTVDHASAVLNRDALHADGAGIAGAPGWWAGAGAALTVEPGNPVHFLTRWVTHLCAPSFVFLAGAALALSVAARRARHQGERAIDLHLLRRGGSLVLLELWMSLAFGLPVLQVLYAIGASIAALAFLRRLPLRALAGAALLWIAGAEALIESLGLRPSAAPPPLFAGLLLVPAAYPTALPGPGVLLVLYPLAHWLAVMLLGWCFGAWLERARATAHWERRAARALALAGGLALSLFALQRALDGYGNFWLPRGDDRGWLRWLQVSKYPPSLAFLALELGLMALALAGLLRLQRRRGERARASAPLALLGRNALFFYVVHLHAIGAAAWLLFGRSPGTPAPFGVAGAWLGALAALVVLVPLCRAFEGLRRRRASVFLRLF